MKRRIYILLIVAAALLLPAAAYCCTTAIFSGKVTKDGRPIIWKNRDSGFLQNRVVYVNACDTVKYSFIYLSNSADTPEAWSGLNSAGFSIMNSVSYNIRREGDETPDSLMDQEGFVMYRALASCATLKDFEDLLDSLQAPWGIEANFGVIDASGGAAYYEVNNYCWIKYDVNDPETAPDGYIIRSNYSFSGREGKGQGYVRYDNALHNVGGLLESGGKVDVRFVMDCLSRSFFQSQYGYNPIERGYNNILDKDFIPRKSTCSVTIVQGVQPNEDPSLAVMWCALGYGPVSQIVPMPVCAGDIIPADMKSTPGQINSKACMRALDRRAEVFFKVGNKTYVDLECVRKYMSEIKDNEDKMYERFIPMQEYWRERSNPDVRQLKDFYEALEIR